MIKIDLDKAIVTVDGKNGSLSHDLASDEAFAIISKAWLRCGWDKKYTYSFSWFGRPVIQLPEDLLRMQEIIYQVRPDVIVETGVAHGGSLVFYASILKAMGKGRVIGIDVEIRPHNRKAIEAHEFSHMITLLENSSIDPKTIEQLHSMILPTEKVMVVLDSNHSKEHVLNELRSYSKLVSLGSYIIAMDGIMADLEGAPRSKPGWSWDNPKAAALEFASMQDSFEVVEPKFPFNEGSVSQRVTYCPCAFLQRMR